MHTYKEPFLMRHKWLRRIVAGALLLTFPIAFPIAVVWDERRQIASTWRDLRDIAAGRGNV